MSNGEQRLSDLEKRIRILEGLLQEKGKGQNSIKADEMLVEIKAADDFINYISEEIAVHKEKNKRVTVKEVDNKINNLQEETHSLLSLMSLVDYKDIPLKRYLPLKVFIEDFDPVIGNLIFAEMIKFVSIYGFEVADEFPAINGSWYKKAFVKAKDVLSQPEVRKRLEKAEYGLELALIRKNQSEIDKNQAEAASSVIQSLASIDNAACQIGSILVIKITNKNQGTNVFVRTLTTPELILLEKDHTLLMKPKKLLELLNNTENER